MKIGKKTQEWIKARDRLKKIYFNKGILRCELNLSGCWTNNALNFAHRYKRSDPRCRHTFKQTLLACNSCHQQIEYNEELTQALFHQLRDIT